MSDINFLLNNRDFSREQSERCVRKNRYALFFLKEKVMLAFFIHILNQVHFLIIFMYRIYKINLQFIHSYVSKYIGGDYILPRR